jgi:hypothetical protein
MLYVKDKTTYTKRTKELQDKIEILLNEYDDASIMVLHNLNVYKDEKDIVHIDGRDINFIASNCLFHPTKPN